MTTTTWTCGWCRGQYTPNRAWQKFCTPPCKRSARSRRTLNKAKGETKPETAHVDRRTRRPSPTHTPARP